MCMMECAQGVSAYTVPVVGCSLYPIVLCIMLTHTCVGSVQTNVKAAVWLGYSSGAGWLPCHVTCCLGVVCICV